MTEATSKAAWTKAGSSNGDSPLHQTHSSADINAAVPQVLRWALILVVLCCTVFQRFGINLGYYSISTALIAVFVLFLVAALTRSLELSSGRLALYSLCIAIAIASTLVNANFSQSETASVTSLILVTCVYLPFAFVIRTSASVGVTTDLPLKIFSDVALVCAAAGIVQFYAQFLTSAEWLFDFAPLIPPALRGPSGFNTLIAVDSLQKSNGFFFREPSGFSFIMAMAVIVEWVRFRRPWRLVIFALAMLLSYSGTGPLTLLIGMFMSWQSKVLFRLLLFACLAILVFWTLGDVLNLSFLLGRLGEFQSVDSSAYLRYIAPMRMVTEGIDNTPWSLLIGHGPGSITRASRADFEFHDPTWAKLLYEYGVLGFLAFVSLFLSLLRQVSVPVEIRRATFWHWLIMGGLLLNPGTMAMTMVMFGLQSKQLSLQPSVDRMASNLAHGTEAGVNTLGVAS